MARSTVRAARHIALVRVLHEPLYVNHAGQVFAAGGRVQHARLRETLARFDVRPTAVEAPTPEALGLPALHGELTPAVLHTIGGALLRWRHRLDEEAGGSSKRAWRQLAERIELTQLAGRLEAVRAWSAECARGGEPEGAPYLLGSLAESQLRSAIDEAARSGTVSHLVAWQARVVCWLSGICAARRFLNAAMAVQLAYPIEARERRILGFQRSVEVWKARGTREPVRNLLVEMALQIRRLPADVVRQGKYSARLRGRTFAAHCDYLLERCAGQMRDDQCYRWHVVPAELAALAAADGSAVALPTRTLCEAASKENFSQMLGVIARIAEQIGEPGYDAMLTAIEAIELSHGFEAMRKLLARGDSPEDCVWANEQCMLHGALESEVKIATWRRVSDAFASRGCPMESHGASLLASRVRDEPHLRPVWAWLGWMKSVSKHVMTPRMRQALWATFWQHYLPHALQIGGFERLAPCIAPAPRGYEARGAEALLTRLCEHQDAIGRSGLPKSVRKIQQRGDAKYAAKLQRAAEEAFLTLGMERLRAVIRAEAELRCRDYLAEWMDRFEPEKHEKLALWIGELSEAERAALRGLIAARRENGREYKLHLEENQDWIERARLHGVDTDAWFGATPEMRQVQGRAMRLEIGADLDQLFLMGEYFKTCLSLDGCNQRAVLANAMDANKQVVFMTTTGADGKSCVVARQLIAVSPDFRLLRYCCYVSDRIARREERPHYERAMAEYCGRLAARCGLELENVGTPESIGNRFWYDDGELEWPEEAVRTRNLEMTQVAVC